ncbi:light-independent protochlorophyllide reductaseiron-sulfur ATP-binding protein [Striga asiatica]|uniref:Light-independent protochlorophyllide reductaseiron-sulfur ATP-binding protein n=1 Tax=Striga asiatica TaxID=4170 RepID=A0A5A7RAX4_STRAF|nr:light-independent protochlorophyllide reductaseiron-sulfur ATP-binding protein [Striga asiatica]
MQDPLNTPVENSSPDILLFLSQQSFFYPMEPTLEAINSNGGSVKVGTTGTISALMSKELDSTKSTTSRTSLDEPSSNRNTNALKNPRNTENTKRMKSHNRSTHQIPMLTADDMSLDGTPIRPKPMKKGPTNVVEIVDIKCGGSDRKWVSPITDRLKKLNFSKLSESIV